MSDVNEVLGATQEVDDPVVCFDPGVLSAHGRLDDEMKHGIELQRSLRLEAELRREAVESETSTGSDAVVVQGVETTGLTADQIVAKAQIEAQRDVFRDDQLVVCPCGVVLPVSKKNLEVARVHRWYRVCKPFNRVFYEALYARGVEGRDAHAAIALLVDHGGRQHLGITLAQVRGLYGLEQGVFGFDGRFRNPTQHDGMDPDTGGSNPPAFTSGFKPEEWPLVQEEALYACRNKPEQVDFQTEMRWVMCRSKEWPDFETGPSIMAIKTWLILNDPAGVEPLTKDLLKMTWAKRMSPGDNGRKAAVFDEDREAQTETTEQQHDQELERRLFGG